MAPRSTAATLQEQDVVVPSSYGVQIATKMCNQHSPFAVILAHPYGPLGGNMFNNVVWALTQHLARFGFTTIRYNQRGVPPSTGRTSWTGAGEKEDMQAVCQYALTQLDQPPRKLLIIGYSFGSVVGSAVGGEMPEVHAYAAISYPFSVAFALTLFQQAGFLTSAAQGNKPKLFVMGTQDQFTGISAFLAKVKRLPSPIEVATLEGLDHFFFGHEAKLCALVQGWLEKILGTNDLKAFLLSGGGGSDALPEVCQDGFQEL